MMRERRCDLCVGVKEICEQICYLCVWPQHGPMRLSFDLANTVFRKPVGALLFLHECPWHPSVVRTAKHACPQTSRAPTRKCLMRFIGFLPCLPPRDHERPDATSVAPFNARILRVQQKHMRLPVTIGNGSCIRVLNGHGLRAHAHVNKTHVRTAGTRQHATANSNWQSRLCDNQKRQRSARTHGRDSAHAHSACSARTARTLKSATAN
jgi:hypothetical protein